MKRILRNWSESQSTWNIYSTGNNWTTAGGTSDGNDRSSTTTATKQIFNSDNGNYVQFTSAQLAADVQDMINTPANNFGWHIERTDGSNDATYMGYTSSEGTDGQRPYLSVTYTAGGGGGWGGLLARNANKLVIPLADS